MNEFFRISSCETAKEIWDTLVETHEGTAEVWVIYEILRLYNQIRPKTNDQA
jgi:hypothetical protein